MGWAGGKIDVSYETVGRKNDPVTHFCVSPEGSGHSTITWEKYT